MSPDGSLPGRWSSAVSIALNVARQHCRNTFDPHVILAVFVYFRTNDTARRIYLAATGAATGFEEDQLGKSILNPLIGREVCRMLGAAKTGVEVDIDGEFIRSYSVLEAPLWRATR